MATAASVRSASSAYARGGYAVDGRQEIFGFVGLATRPICVAWPAP